MKRAVAVIIVVTVVGCAPANETKAAAQKEGEPYGLWSTERGQTIAITRDGKYKYCDGGACEVGYQTMDGNCALLLGFADMEATANLRRVSGWEEMRKVATNQMDDVHRGALDVCDYGMSAKMKHDLCQDRACRIVGRHEGDIYRLVKTENY